MPAGELCKLLFAAFRSTRAALLAGKASAVSFWQPDMSLRGLGQYLARMLIALFERQVCCNHSAPAGSHSAEISSWRLQQRTLPPSTSCPQALAACRFGNAGSFATAPAAGVSLGIS
jgi:hypothetical protein